MKIIVGLSGGVDSSVTALLLKEAGHEVTGVTMSIWDGTMQTTGHKKSSCFGPDEKYGIEKTRLFCDEIGIPFHVFDCVKEYKEIILAYFKNEYLMGRTPNPCIKCNQLIKFGVLVSAARKSGLDFDLFSTGHYVRVEGDVRTRRIILRKAIDEGKDQSYFLYRLTQDQLAGLFFPLGYYTKDYVREIAKQKGLAMHDSEESQDFYGGSYSELLDVKEKTGNIVDKDGVVLGKHKGIWHYTRGQRRGLGVAAGKPLYVIDINAEKNEIVAGYEEESYSNGFFVKDLNWISVEPPDKELKVNTKVRSTQKEKQAVIFPCDANRMKVVLGEPQKAVAPGQSAVFYINDYMIGGGFIDEVF
ncbi:MAG: tRNA 2-thiouridine(34) synthase MnmA [Spirochaetales bacterium]|nr:tRNA 2-thiouridine(34) synthase MnmA [Spirochaetales bacterium]